MDLVYFSGISQLGIDRLPIILLSHVLFLLNLFVINKRLKNGEKSTPGTSPKSCRKAKK